MLVYNFKDKKNPSSNYYKVMKRLRKRINCQWLIKGVIFFPVEGPLYSLDEGRNIERRRELSKLISTINSYGGDVMVFGVELLDNMKSEEFARVHLGRKDILI